MTYIVSQDGRDFYLCNEADDLTCVVSYPGRVSDFDLDEARKARIWFETLMKAWNVSVAWERN